MKKTYLLYFSLFLIISNTLAEIIQPILPPARAQFSPQQACLLPHEQIRREHGTLLKQAHDVASLQHRAPNYHLGDCLDCHIYKNAAGKFPEIDSSAHFCQSCHLFVGTKIACFSCHPAQ